MRDEDYIDDFIREDSIEADKGIKVVENRKGKYTNRTEILKFLEGRTNDGN